MENTIEEIEAQILELNNEKDEIRAKVKELTYQRDKMVAESNVEDKLSSMSQAEKDVLLAALTQKVSANGIESEETTAK